MAAAHRVSIDEDRANPSGPRRMGNIVKIAVGVWDVEINCRRDDGVLQSETRCSNLERRGSSHGVADHRFDRANWNVVRMRPESALECPRFGEIVIGYSIAMRADVVDVGCVHSSAR